ncbi:hypothetical protein [Streptococcus acidominimus]|uniref:Uncharacterized protein n=1 Tax=Streptococcus acidominimus TaxID=1326 RepID=A0A380IDJ0_STRAI|nr:hypothetical protein [Streptococcus acidominimus]SUN06616.1 Uncharacterised protein [Streptococcus acidominimus]
MRKKLLILLLILGGIMIAFGLYGVRQKQMEAERNRQYEVSLVKALKNSYRDLEEIEISNPDYSVPPGDWSCKVMLKFRDNTIVTYRIGTHFLITSINLQQQSEKYLIH